MIISFKDYDLKKVISNIAFFYPVLYTFLYTINPSLSNGLFKVIVILLLLASVNSIVRRDKYINKNILVLGMLLVIAALEVSRTSIRNLGNQDVFGYVGLILLFSIYIQDDYRNELIDLCIDYNRYKIVISGFYTLLLFGVVFKHGLRAEGWGVSVPLLYGQFEIPHSLAYILLALYALSSLQYRLYKKKLPLYMMGLSFVCVVWTGVRSGLLALLILVIMDYLGIKNKTRKITVMFVLVVGVLGLLSFTDILTNNPLVQKTMNAAESGTISNGRDKFAQVLFAYYLFAESNMERFCGIGINGIRQIMKSVYNVEIHAHNDFFNVLLGYGMPGTVLFWSMLIAFCKKVKFGFIVFVILVILALTNGLFMYISFTPLMIYLAIYVDQFFDKNDLYKDRANQIEEKKSIFYMGK